MNRKIYKKEDTIEVIVEQTAGHFDKKELEKEIVSLYGDIEKWKNLLELEIGYAPTEEFEECPHYEMPQITIRHYLGDDEEGILKYDVAHRNKRVEQWLMYFKIVLKKKNPIRNIDSLFKSFGLPLTDEEKDQVRDFLKKEDESLEI